MFSHIGHIDIKQGGMVLKIVLGITIYNVKELSEMLGVSITTIHSYIKNGTLDARKFGGCWHITEETIKTFIGGTNAHKGGDNIERTNGE
jgi:excisionase family DNA binding protein